MAGALTIMFGLAGCAAPDPAPVETALTSVPGVQGAQIYVSHPGAPWNVKPLITLFVANGDADSVEATVRSAVAALADGPFGGQAVTIWLVPGEPSDYETAEDVSFAHLSDLNPLARKLGLRATVRGDSLSFTSDDIRRIAGEQ